MMSTLSRLHIIVIAVLGLAMSMTRCFGWGGDGHRMIGAIAQSQLNEQAAEAVKGLLGDETLAEACCWADKIRGEKEYAWVSPLHYINAPRDAKTVDLDRDGLDGQQIVSSIGKYREILKDSEKPKEERILALRLLAHFVGDIHQPLHVSYKDDKGGNMLTVTHLGTRSSMHSVWDSGFIKQHCKKMELSWETMGAALRETITPDEQRRWSQSLDPVEWANESLVLTISIYAKLPEPPKVKGADDFTESDAQHWMPTVADRLQTAGVRLGAVLNDALGSSK
ncbi:MAG: S1/P1 nuclease [Planctomycetota bacterium]|nr:S1/P1 nuclease [Planctomycetota bacterium]